MINDLRQICLLLNKQEKIKLGLIFGLMLMAAAMEATAIGAVPAYVAFLMDPSSLHKIEWFNRVLPELPKAPDAKLAIMASLALLSFILIKNFFLIFVYYAQTRLISGQQLRLGNRMFRAYQTASYDWILQRSSAELQRNIQADTSTVFSGVLLTCLDLILSLAMSLMIVCVMIFATPSSTLISIGIVGLGLWALIRGVRNQMAEIGRISREESGESIKAIQQGFGAFIDARILGCEAYLAKVYQNSLARMRAVNIRAGVINRATPYIIESIAILGMLIILIALIYSGQSITESIPTLSVIAVVIIRLKRIASQVATNVNTINRSRPYIPGLIKDIEDLDRMENTRRQKIAENQLIENFQELSIEDIQYTYPNCNTPALQSISLNLKKGESIALVGQTGCGKSTLVNCILGLLYPQKGSIQVNGHNIEADPEGWRRCLGYIPQVIYLIDDTIRANIAFGVPPAEVDEARLASAIDSAALSKYISELHKGLDTIIGERGIRLSGGQRQRLGIARALYFNPEILVMDEATSALDNKTENEVMQAIQNLKKDRTLIMIAHRLSTVIDCDRLYFLEKGLIRASGDYSSLVDSSPEFRDMAAVNL